MPKTNYKTMFLALSFVCVPTLSAYILSGNAKDSLAEIFAAIVLVLVFGIILSKKYKSIANGVMVFGVLVLFAFVSSTNVYISQSEYAAKTADELGTSTHTFYGFCEKSGAIPQKNMFVKIVSADGRKLKHEISAYTKNISGHYFDEGSFVRLSGKLRVVENKNNAFDMKRWLLGKNVYCEIYDVSDIKTDYALDTFLPASEIREFVFNKTMRVLKYIDDKESFERSSAFVKALLFGDKSGFKEKELEVFTKSGNIHLLCVSGMHFSLFIGGVSLLLCAFVKRRSFKIAVIGLLSILYLAMCDFNLSAVRSAVMIALSGLGTAFGKRHKCTYALLFALTIICIVYPNSIFDTGFCLSVLSCIGISFVGYINEIIVQKLNLCKIAAYIVTCFILSFASFCFTFGYLVCAMGGVSLVAPITSILTCFPAEICMGLSFLCIPVAFLDIEIISFVLSRTILFLSDYIYAVSDCFSSLKYGYIQTETMDLSMLVFLSAVGISSLCITSKARAAKIFINISVVIILIAAIFVCFA